MSMVRQYGSIVSMLERIFRGCEEMDLVIEDDRNVIDESVDSYSHGLVDRA